MCTAWAKRQSTSKLHVMLVPGDLPVAVARATVAPGSSWRCMFEAVASSRGVKIVRKSYVLNPAGLNL